MQNRIILSLITAAVIVLSLGLRSMSSEAAASRALSALPGDSTVAAALELSVTDGVTFRFTVVNNTPKRVELQFPSGQTHDFVVLDSLGREVWRWSEGRLFTQVLQNRLVPARQSIAFEETWKGAPAGSYTAVARLRSRNFPLEERVEFTIPANEAR